MQTNGGGLYQLPNLTPRFFEKLAALVLLFSIYYISRCKIITECMGMAVSKTTAAVHRNVI